ncbi:hypothetical protein CSAL01_09620 [Colletotrichum salicis]|uniref:Uncharacterized protein n=1 Tax=Colletotrichum salicis TaxID=1209931 RepID=A0A135UGK2_9PEZI|nr:hypothetical protein CSAL01_09620 [Colletotrichum salicis]
MGGIEPRELLPVLFHVVLFLGNRHLLPFPPASRFDAGKIIRRPRYVPLPPPDESPYIGVKSSTSGRNTPPTSTKSSEWQDPMGGFHLGKFSLRIFFVASAANANAFFDLVQSSTMTLLEYMRIVVSISRTAAQLKSVFYRRPHTVYTPECQASIGTAAAPRLGEPLSAVPSRDLPRSTNDEFVNGNGFSDASGLKHHMDLSHSPLRPPAAHMTM